MFIACGFDDRAMATITSISEEEMMRDTTKHGPRLDEQLKRETRSLEQGAPLEPRAQEWREHEPSGELDRDVDTRPRAPGTLGSDEVEARRELSRHLRARVFPADRTALLAEAEEQQAPQAVSDALSHLPADVVYATVHEVWAGLQGYEDVAGAARGEPLSERDTSGSP
jgi:Protein of unknown function (DUF2795)